MRATGSVFTYGAYEKRDTTGRFLGWYQPPESLGYEDVLVGCPVGCLTAAYVRSLCANGICPVYRGQDWGCGSH